MPSKYRTFGVCILSSGSYSKEVSWLFVEIVISVFQQPETTIKNECQWILLEEEINVLSYTHTFGPY